MLIFKYILNLIGGIENMFTRNPHQKRLSDDTCQHLRYLYFIENEMLNTLSKKYDVSITTLKKALHSKPPYDKVTDNIPKSTKESRKPLGKRQKIRKVKYDQISRDMELKRESERRTLKNESSSLFSP